MLRNKTFPKRLLALGFLLGLVLIIYIYHPATSFRMIPCPFREFTGLYCPGCGSVRALTQIVRGNLLKAIKHNVFAVAFLPLLIWVIISNFIMVITGKALRYPQPPAKVIWVLLFLFLLFAVLRNLPFPQLHFLRP